MLFQFSSCTTHHNLNASCMPLVRCGSCHLLPMHGRNVRHALLVPPNMCTCSSLSHLKALHKSPLCLDVHLAFNHMPFMKPRWYPWGFAVACLSQNANNSPPVNDSWLKNHLGSPSIIKIKAQIKQKSKIQNKNFSYLKIRK